MGGAGGDRINVPTGGEVILACAGKAVDALVPIRLVQGRGPMRVTRGDATGASINGDSSAVPNDRPASR